MFWEITDSFLVIFNSPFNCFAFLDFLENLGDPGAVFYFFCLFSLIFGRKLEMGCPRCSVDVCVLVVFSKNSPFLVLLGSSTASDYVWWIWGPNLVFLLWFLLVLISEISAGFLIFLKCSMSQNWLIILYFIYVFITSPLQNLDSLVVEDGEAS